MAFSFSIPTIGEAFQVNVESGCSAIFVGANGGGKTRLAVFIENQNGVNAHRISAHRSLSLNPSVPKISERQALSGLRTGYGSADSELNIGNRPGSRWQSKEAVFLLNDYDFLVQALFADQSNKALSTHKKNRVGDTSLALPTNFEKLIEIWDRLLPHRKIETTGDDIKVKTIKNQIEYKASDMSDGERAIFYLIGQTLTAAENSLLIFDEPELHIHRSIMSKLWDELEAARTDCAFVFITHDLEFAAARAAQKFVLSEYTHIPSPCWVIESVPVNTGFDESLATLILGSRKPILFVEGLGTSLDLAIYRSCYPEWTVIAKGSCEEVIHSVVTFRKNAQLTRVTCSGIVDADDYQAEDQQHLQTLGIHTLSVSEVENLLLLPDVSRAIAAADGYSATEIDGQLVSLANAIYAKVDEPDELEKVVIRFCKRRIDRALKKIDLGDPQTIENLQSLYGSATSTIDIPELAHDVTARIEKARVERNLPLLLAIFDHKGLVALAAQHLKRSRQKEFLDWLLRVLRNNSHPGLTKALREALPTPTNF
jgi:energy-coupling factor transporter ATP-binding protein EcfA2